MLMLHEDSAPYGIKRFVGRDYEQDLLTECLYSEQSEFVAVYGRRRVGKTFLIRSWNVISLFMLLDCREVRIESRSTISVWL